jgi:hypothetical protein
MLMACVIKVVVMQEEENGWMFAFSAFFMAIHFLYSLL